tara:strand:+ start:1167 stop:2903 length:1737 start_codon:yes stop_codon:yes gene_type:complete
MASVQSTNKGKARKKRKPKLTADERKQRATERAFKRQVRGIFSKIGFKRIPEAADKEFEFQNRKSDFDDFFVKENLIVFTEYTLSNEKGLGDHFKNKAHIYNLIKSDSAAFLNFILGKFPAIQQAISPKYHNNQLVFRILYCSPLKVKSEHQALAEHVVTISHATMQYFKLLTNTIKFSARHELYQFLGLAKGEVGELGVISDDVGVSEFGGTLLPETHSNYPTGFKVVSFYVSPGALLSRAYVLRKAGWKDQDGLYQRMIERGKVENIRKYLKTEQRVFVNNVIVTLPPATKIADEDGKETLPSEIKKTTPVRVRIPQEPNCVGIVDGQHRIFSYYEDGTEDNTISVFRDRQNLLATGIIYPESIPAAERTKFEASLFLEINSNQNSARSDLKQAIAVLTKPFSAEAIGKRIITKLSEKGPLEGLIAQHFFDRGVLRTTSIVAYALRPLVRLDGDESMITLWSEPNKDNLIDGSDAKLIDEYVDWCLSEINQFISAVKANLKADDWQISSKKEPGLLNVTMINSLIILFRKVINRDGVSGFSDYSTKLTKIGSFKFKDYHSSQYNRMAEQMLAKYYQ